MDRFNTLHPKNAPYFSEGRMSCGRRADFVVVELEVHEKIKKIREEIYKKIDIKDTHTDYNPHITLGKLKNFQDFRPYPTTKVIFDCELK